MITSRAPVVVFVAPSGCACGVGRVRADDCGRRRGHGAGHAHRRRASGLRRRTEDGRDDWRRRRRRMQRRTCGRWPRRATGTSRSPNRRCWRAAPSPTERPRAHRRRSSTSSPRDVADLLTQLDGRTIKRFDGRPVVLHTRDADCGASRCRGASGFSARSRIRRLRICC